MPKIDAVKCDSCGTIVAAEDAHEKLVRYKGPRVNGEYTEYLCDECTVLPNGVELRPWPRMKSSNQSPEPVEG